MAKKSSLTQSLETAQKNAARELEKTRKRIRKQATVTSYEYAILYEDSFGEAKAGAERIDELMMRAADEGGPTLIAVCPRDGMHHLVLTKPPFLTLKSEVWEVHGTHHLVWDDSKLSMLQTLEVARPDTGKFVYSYPLHRLLANPECFIVIGERDVADRLVTAVKRESGKPPHYDRFNFFYHLTKKLGYELRDKKLKKRVEEERERVAGECRSHLKSLAGVLDELFVHGARPPYHNFKGDASPMLLSRAKGLATSMGDSIRECKLYGVDTEESREIAAFGKRWITYFNLGEDKT
jgi:hypothetical protein